MSQKRRRAPVKLEESPKKPTKRNRLDEEEDENFTAVKKETNTNSKTMKAPKRIAGTESSVKGKRSKAVTVKGKSNVKETPAEESAVDDATAIDIPIDEEEEEEEEEEYSVEIVAPSQLAVAQIQMPREDEASSEEDHDEFEDHEYEETEDNEELHVIQPERQDDLDIDALMETALAQSQNGNFAEDSGQKRSYKREFNIPCAYCEVMLKDYGYLFRHVMRLHKHESDVDEYLNEIRPRMRTSCPICNKTVSSASNVSAHIKQCHAGEESSVKCPLCSKAYKTQISLKQHLRQCHQPQVRKHKCTHCDMTFTEGRSLKEHINCTHETTQIFRCDDCGKTFLTKGRLRRHKYIHSEFRHYCSYCKKGFHLKDNMNKHVEIMHEKKFGKRFQCPHCPKNFTVKGNMKQHIMGVHLRQYAYNCPICGEGYRRKKDMLLHMEQHKEGMSTLKIEDVKIDPHTIKLPPPSVKVQMAPSDGLTTGTTVIEVLPQNIKVLTE